MGSSLDYARDDKEERTVNEIKNMNMKNILASGKILLLLAAPLFLTFCSRNEELIPEDDVTGKTVTLTLRSAETVSSPDTRTSLAGNGQVLWSEDDFVAIWTTSSFESYPVIPDPENPGTATIENVLESDVYVVSYPSGTRDWPAGELGDFVTVNIDPYQIYAENSFASEENPMIGYGTSTDIELRNVASVARFGITGTGAVSYLAFAANDGSNISGDIRIPVEDLRSGNMDDFYSDFSSEYSTSIALDCIDGEENPAPVQLSTDPVWFHMVVPAKTYQSGFTLYVMDAERNVAARKMTVPVSMPRSTVVPVEPFEFEPLPEPKIEVTETTSNSITYTVTAEPGMTIMTGVAYKALYDSYPAGPGNGDEYTQYDVAMETLYNSPEGFVTVGNDGTYTYTATRVCNYDCEYVDMSAAMEYYVMAAYAVPGDMPIGNAAVEPASTREAAGEGPSILDFSVLSESTCSKLVMNISLEGEVSALKLGLFCAAEYDGYASSGMEPRDMVLAYGKVLDEAMIDAAVSGVLYYETDYDDRIYPSTEYSLVLLATGPDGAESVLENRYTTAEHFPADASWEMISSEATVTLQDYYNGWNLHFKSLTAERLAGENIYRIRLDIYQDDFSGYMSSLGCMPTGEEPVYLYIDGNTSADIFGSGMPEPVAQVFPNESYVPFETGDGLPVYFHSSGYTAINEWNSNISIDIHTVLTPDYVAETSLAYQHLSIYSPVQAAPVTGSMSNEDFSLQEETPWN